MEALSKLWGTGTDENVLEENTARPGYEIRLAENCKKSPAHTLGGVQRVFQGQLALTQNVGKYIKKKAINTHLKIYMHPQNTPDKVYTNTQPLAGTHRYAPPRLALPTRSCTRVVAVEGAVHANP